MTIADLQTLLSGVCDEWDISASNSNEFFLALYENTKEQEKKCLAVLVGKNLDDLIRSVINIKRVN